MDSNTGLVRVLLAVGYVRLIEVSLDCVTPRSHFGVIEVTSWSDIGIMVAVHTAAIMLTLRGAAAKTPVIKVSVSSATHTAVSQVFLSRAAQAGVIEVTGAAAPKTEVIEVKVEEAALSARKCHEATLCVTTSQVVVFACGRVGGGA